MSNVIISNSPNQDKTPAHGTATESLQPNKSSGPSIDPSNIQKPPNPKPRVSLPVAIGLTLALVVIVREGAVLVCQALGFASAANVVGMVTLFILLMLWRVTLGLPQWITEASNTLLVDSGFAFLPVSAGAGLLLFGLGDELWGIVLTILISTLIPLWGLAKLSNLWLKHSKQDHPPQKASQQAESSRPSSSTASDTNSSNSSTK